MPLYAVAIGLSAFLLFLVQPIIARQVLPWFGGSAAVWTVCLLFFQCGLLLGYLHAHLSRRLLAPRARATVHAALLLASTALLPIGVTAPSGQPASGAPALALLGLLARAVGLPYVLLSSTGPLLQDWYAARFGREPYRLFALSNLMSLLGLLAYPFVVEPHLGVAAQGRAWSWGYGLFCVATIAVALDARRIAPAKEARDGLPVAAPAGGEATAPSRLLPVLWLALPACATLLLGAVTNHLTEDVAAIPLLWVLPLGVYLGTFILAFSDERLYPRRLLLALLLAALPALAFSLMDGHTPKLRAAVALWSGGLLVACLVLHGELSRLRPPPAALTRYYLMMSAGGALGGLLVALVAPVVFPAPLELEVALVACAVVALVAWRARTGREPPRPPSVWRDGPWPLVGALGWVATLTVMLVMAAGDRIEAPRLAVRNFHGALRVLDVGEEGDRVRKLVHGTINHGAQWLVPAKARDAVTYYCPESGVGQAFEVLRQRRGRPLVAGVVGLGAGSLAGYGRAGDRLRFYELNQLSERIARTEFTWLGASPATIDVVLGDARLALQAEGPNRFDLLAVDAFSGDAIPVHLLTREAFALYARHLAPGGVLAIHISNKHLDLGPVVADGAAAIGRGTREVDSDDDDGRYCFGARWVLVSEDAGLLGAGPLGTARALPAPAAAFRPWTDDYSNLLAVMKK